MNLHEDQELFSELIRAAADYIGTRDGYIEKDCWVTYALKNLFTSNLWRLRWNTIGSIILKYSLDGIFFSHYHILMHWEVEYTDEFGEWWNSLSEAEQISIAASVQLLETMGPTLGYPHSSKINGSKHSHMRELRTQHEGRPLRTLYAFDPRRTAILLIGGDKTGDNQWYEKYIPIADQLYDEHLEDIGYGK